MLDDLARPRVALLLADGRTLEAPITGAGELVLGPVTVRVDAAGWAVANRGDDPVAVRAVRLVWEEQCAGPVRFFAHGYQSWSASPWVTLGKHVDPARQQRIWLVRGLHHADPDPAPEGEARAEQVGVLQGRAGDVVLVGFTGGDRHAGTVRVRLVDRGPTVEVVAEAFLGGATLAPGAILDLHPVVRRFGVDADALLAGWAADVGVAAGARTTAPYATGWCSWYHWFHDVTEADVRANLAVAADGGWPFDVFQVDDGYQEDLGDWLATNDKFPSGVRRVARAISQAGFTPGIWLAPFLVSPTSEVAHRHPEWLVRWADGRPLVGNVNPGWGGEVWVLDTTQPDVLAHLEALAAALRDAGYPYLKLDFTYAPALLGHHADPSVTPAARVRAGLDAIRRGAGDDAFLLGCGCPLGPAVGVVDGMRIGPDVAPSWEPPPDAWVFEGYEATAPSTASALAATEARRFMHRRLWVNDPDCVMLRQAATALSPAQATRWAAVAATGGGMLLLSDDLALLGPAERDRFTALAQAGRAADAPSP